MIIIGINSASQIFNCPESFPYTLAFSLCLHGLCLVCRVEWSTCMFYMIVVAFQSS